MATTVNIQIKTDGIDKVHAADINQLAGAANDHAADIDALAVSVDAKASQASVSALEGNVADLEAAVDALDTNGTTVTWDTLPGKPDAFTAAYHTHPAEQIDGLEDLIADIIAGSDAPPPAQFPPQNIALPVIEGNTSVGGTLQVTMGVWSGNPLPTILRRWQHLVGDVWLDLVPATGVLAFDTTGLAPGTQLRVRERATSTAYPDAPIQVVSTPVTLMSGILGDDQWSIDWYTENGDPKGRRRAIVSPDVVVPAGWTLRAYSGVDNPSGGSFTMTLASLSPALTPGDQWVTTGTVSLDATIYVCLAWVNGETILPASNVLTLQSWNVLYPAEPDHSALTDEQWSQEWIYPDDDDWNGTHGRLRASSTVTERTDGWELVWYNQPGQFSQDINPNPAWWAVIPPGGVFRTSGARPLDQPTYGIVGWRYGGSGEPVQIRSLVKETPTYNSGLPEPETPPLIGPQAGDPPVIAFSGDGSTVTIASAGTATGTGADGEPVISFRRWQTRVLPSTTWTNTLASFPLPVPTEDGEYEFRLTQNWENGTAPILIGQLSNVLSLTVGAGAAPGEMPAPTVIVSTTPALQAAMNNHPPGTVIGVAPGTYSGLISVANLNKRTADGRNMIIRAQNFANPPVFVGQADSSNPPISLNTTTGFEFHGLHFVSPRRTTVDGQSGGVGRGFEGVRAHHTVIKGCLFDWFHRQVGFDVSDNLNISWNTFRRGAMDALRVFFSNGNPNKTSFQNIIIEHNDFQKHQHYTHAEHDDHIQFAAKSPNGGVTNIRIRKNKFDSTVWFNTSGTNQGVMRTIQNIFLYTERSSHHEPGIGPWPLIAYQDVLIEDNLIIANTQQAIAINATINCAIRGNCVRKAAGSTGNNPRVTIYNQPLNNNPANAVPARHETLNIQNNVLVGGYGHVYSVNNWSNPSWPTGTPYQKTAAAGVVEAPIIGSSAFPVGWADPVVGHTNYVPSV